MRQLALPLGDPPGEKWYVPDFMADSVTDIDFTFLHGEGIRCVALDVDSTLVPHGGVNLTEETITFLRTQHAQGRIDRLYLATNRSAARLGELQRLTGAEGVVYAKGLRRKPFVSYYQHLLARMGCRPEESVMVGDKVWQDVYGANRAGMTTVLVEPVGPAAWFDKLLLHRWRQQQILRRLQDDLPVTGP